MNLFPQRPAVDGGRARRSARAVRFSFQGGARRATRPAWTTGRDRLEACPTSPNQRGVALVITLILLAVISTLAIAFLGLTQRETSSVDSMARTTDAEVSADSALERAKAEITAVYPARNQNVAANGPNILGPDMTVSVCCQNYDNVPGSPTYRRTISYDRLNPDFRITNRYDAAPPVFVQTNAVVNAANPLDDRFFLDLNRNGIFEDTGRVPDTTDVAAGPGRFQFDASSGNISTNWRIGDPQWIGVLQNPRRAHSANNRFIGRYAFMVVPAGRTLDVNWIHNDTKSTALPTPGLSWYARNQGVGGYENNLAGFFCDLNANIWNNPNAPYNAAGYVHNTDLGTASRGTAFSDAWDVLSFRFAGSKNNQNNLYQLFPNIPPANLDALFQNDLVDSYALSFPSGPDNDVPGRIWPGSDSTNHLFSLHDYFGRIQSVSNRLAVVSGLGNSYDRYTYYRMLAQLGTDSPEEEEEGKIDVNYVNIPSPVTGERILASDLVPWSTTNSQPFIHRLGRPVDMGRPLPELFFITAVTNLLAREPALAFMVTNKLNPNVALSIPIFTNGATFTTNLPLNGPLYSARLHQLLQVVANIHDATTGSKSGETFPFYPSIFRPWFTASNGNVYITDYSLVTDSATNFQSNFRWRDLESGDRLSSDSGSSDLVYGIPLIVGARKGYPNFNELAVVTMAEASRKLLVTRSTLGKDWDKLEQDFSLGIRTKIQLEARNSYSFANIRPLQLQVGLNVRLQVKERTNLAPILTTNWVTGVQYNYPVSRWPGEPQGSQQNDSYVATPLFETNYFNWSVFTNADGTLPTNGWTASLENRMLYYLVDTSVPGGRIVDVVTFNRPTNYFEIGRLMEEPIPGGGALARIWSSDKTGKTAEGIRVQLAVSAGAPRVSEGVWGNYDQLTARSKDDAITKFQEFMNDQNLLGTNQAPFSPILAMVQANYYQVSDPLVHYTFEDLGNDTQKSVYSTEPLNGIRTNLNISIGSRNPNTVTWNRGQFGETSGTAGEGPLDSTVRDPGMVHSDYWDFPTNSFPNLGALGRVHRGTPWQTVYFKSRSPNQNWIDHTGNQRANHPNAANLMQPRRDWELLDVFTSSPHPNAARGRMSINQTNLAAWSAVLSGVMASEVIENPDAEGFIKGTNTWMQPAAIAPLGGPVGSIETIVTNINAHRTLYSSNAYNPYGEFTRLSQLLSAPVLTDDSPFLNNALFNARKPEGNAQVFDTDYERIPAQILSLLKVGEPRFVIYAWGQSLKPARLGFEGIDRPLSGPSIDPGTKVVNNYQVTGEVATRAVVKVVFPERESNNTTDPGYVRPDYRKPRLVVESFNIIPVE